MEIRSERQRRRLKAPPRRVAAAATLPYADSLHAQSNIAPKQREPDAPLRRLHGLIRVVPRVFRMRNTRPEAVCRKTGGLGAILFCQEEKTMYRTVMCNALRKENIGQTGAFRECSERY